MAKTKKQTLKVDRATAHLNVEATLHTGNKLGECDGEPEETEASFGCAKFEARA